MRPLPRTSLSRSCLGIKADKPSWRSLPIVAEFSMIFSCSMTWNVARPAIIARSFWPKVVEWTRHRSSDEKTLLCIDLREMTAARGM